ncbi:MAG: uroporphyrinogen-III C-methyltransferase [Burkholderiaceae bacterium]
MSEPSTPNPQSPPSPLPEEAERVAVPPPRHHDSAQRYWLIGVVILAVVTVWAHVSLSRFKDEAGRRIADLERRVTLSQDAAVRAEAEARAATQKVGELESQLAEEQGQRETLEELYTELSRGRDDAAVIEVDRLVSMAAQELQLGANINAALAALQTADSRLARVDNARFVPLRRALARDIERLKAAPAVDVTGLALKLDTLAQAVDLWPLAADARALAPLPAAPAKPGSTRAPLAEAADGWARARAWVAAEFGDLVRIREVNSPEALLIGPAQQRLVRQELRLRLLDARQALLARNDRIFRADLAEADAMLTRYFDIHQPAVIAGQTQLRALAKTVLSVDAPTISDSLSAARQLRGAAR